MFWLGFFCGGFICFLFMDINARASVHGYARDVSIALAFWRALWWPWTMAKWLWRAIS